MFVVVVVSFFLGVVGIEVFGIAVAGRIVGGGGFRVVAIDINQARLDLARAQGFADEVYCLPAADKAKTSEEQLRRAKENVAAALKQFEQQDGFDLVFECTGAEPCIQMSIHVRLFLSLRSFYARSGGG